jgi:aryl-alcohol dehydrogenase-like predicted oxidoreductase
MAAFCAAHGISLLPYGVVAGGLLSERYLGVPAAKAGDMMDTYSLGKYARVLQETGGWAFLQALLGVLAGVAAKHGATIANVATAWVLSRPATPAVIIGARNALHVDDHRAACALKLDADDLGAIDAALARGRRATSDTYQWERGLAAW